MLLVSVIIPTYNQEKLIQNAILSSANQTYKNIEVIIIDDASTDNTESIVAQLIKDHSHVAYHRNAANIGRVKTYHKGIYELAKGDLSILLDGDDYFIDSTFIEKAVSEIKQAGTDNILFFQADHFTLKPSDAASLQLSNSADFTFEYFTAKQYLKHFHKIGFSHLTTIVNRKLAIENNFYTADILSSDIDSFLRLCLAYPDRKIIKTNAKVAVWLKHGSNASGSKSIKKLLPSLKIYFSMAKHKNAKVAGISSLWALRQSARPIISILLRKAGLLK